jgi:hypothetical protein
MNKKLDMKRFMSARQLSFRLRQEGDDKKTKIKKLHN